MGGGKRAFVLGLSLKKGNRSRFVVSAIKGRAEEKAITVSELEKLKATVKAFTDYK